MKKSKIIIKTIFWPVLLWIGQFAISFLLFLFFASKHPALEGQALTKAFAPFIETQAYLFLLWNTLIFLPIFYRKYKKYKVGNNGIGKGDIVSILLLALPLCVSLNLILSLFTQNAVKPTFSIIILLSTGVIGPILEELSFRGIALEESKKLLSKKNAYIFITLFFAFSHQGITQIFYALVMGSIFLFIKEKYKNINAAIICHISVNTLSYFLSFFLLSISIPYKIFVSCLLFVLFVLILHKQLKKT
ncbi:MAG: type II CAAX endopeptidase family protein [Bacilli bacterium]|nr:type II CAAX endopeptidase family protein [Bacilli bacterium]